MEKIKAGFQKIIGKILGMKLRYRMVLLYLLGGALPSLCIGVYLISGSKRTLTDQAKTAEVTEMEMVRQQTQELLSTVSMVSKYFFFDEKLENIAAKEYTDYQEMVNDFRDYTAFTQYGNYYNNRISWISVYMENDTLRGNSHFVKVDDEIREQEWYQAAKNKKGGAIWQYLRMDTEGYESLTLTRLIRTKKGEEVGVLVVYIRPGYLTEILGTGGSDVMLVLNGETMVAKRTANTVDFADICELLPEPDGETHQSDITVGREKYVLTCAGIEIPESGDCIQIVSLRSLDEILEEVDKQNRGSIIIFMMGAGLSVMMIIGFSWSFGKRVGQFHEQMQRAAAGEFDLVSTLGGSDEISELYDFLGTMISEIRRLLSEVYRERLRAEKLKTEQKDAEYKMLASQINPHFLYNTLETIRMKARVNGQYDIERLVKMLAKILRKNIQAGSQDVTLQMETDLIECYLEIQKYRFGERIQYQIYIEKDLEEYHVFPLLMQPIVENSIIHGLEIKEGIGHIDITVIRQDKNVCITIRDDGVGMDQETLKKLRESMNRETQTNKHIGVGNVHRRIRLRYGDEYGIQIDSTPGGGTTVIILLPGEEKNHV